MTSSHHLLPLLEPNEHHQYFPFLTSPSQPSLSSSSSQNPFQDQLKVQIKQYQPSQGVGEYVSQGGSSDHQSVSPPSLSTLESGSEYRDQILSDSSPADKGSASWMSSKMRLMKKMMNPDRSSDALKPIRKRYWFQDPKLSSPSDNLASNSATLRTCSDCNTTRTPLWRSGPKGPKSLCNACGIRQRKARRALAAATAGSTTNGVLPTETPPVTTKKKPGRGRVTQHKKQCKRKPNNVGFEDFIVNLSNNLVIHHMFPQDETEAAILLMALSCGLVNG